MASDFAASEAVSEPAAEALPEQKENQTEKEQPSAQKETKNKQPSAPQTDSAKKAVAKKRRRKYSAAVPLGGFFILMALIVGFFVDHFPGKVALHIVGMVLGLAICYIFGTVWLAGQLNMTFVAGLGVGVIPYLPGDAVKIIFTALIGPKLRREIYRLGE